MKTQRVGVRAVLLALLAVSFGVMQAKAQSTTDGAIGGTVFDPSGAAVADAKVTVKSNGTNIEQSVVTDETGYFRVAKLQPGSYAVTIEASGFAAFKVAEAVVQVGTVTEIPVHLNLASAGATVLVSYELPQVNTTSADFAPTVDQVAINNLPINGGRWSSFALLTPGAVNDASGFGLISFRGMSTLLNNNTVDGGDNNQAFFSEERGRTRIGYSSAKAAVQEFQVNTSNYSSEYGRAAGAVINTVTKSGGNQYHGEVYFYDRDNDWGAINPFTTLTTKNASGSFVTSPYKPVDVRKMYGFGAGGHLIKDRLFFFFAFDRYDRNFPGTAKANSPLAFFAAPVPDLTPYGGSCAAITGNSPSAIANQNLIKALPNGANVLTATQGSCTLFSNLALADYAGGVTDYNNGLNGLLGELGPVPRKGQATIFFPKIDWQINTRNHATVEVNRMRWGSPAGIQTQASNNFGVASFGNDYVRNTWGVIRLYTSITNTLTNEARFQYGRDLEFEFPQAPTASEQANLVTSPNFPGYTNPLGLPPDVCIQCGSGNGFEFGVPTFLQRPAFPDERRTQYADTVSWTHAKHSFKFGVDFAHTNDLSKNLRFQFGSFNYSSLGSFFSDLLQPNRCGTAHTTPCYSSYQQAFGPLGFSFNTNDIAFFGEDSWRVLPRFTLTLGLRYEYEILPSVILPNPGVPQTQSFPSDKNNLGPRIGFAWDILGDGKTAVRGGYGIYYGRVINSTIYNALINTGVQGGQFSFFFTAKPNGTPAFPQILTAQPPPSSGLSIVLFDKNFQLPQVHQADLTVEREIAKNTVVSVSYLGSFGRSLPDFVDINTGDPATTITYKVNGGGPIAAGTYTTPLYATITTTPAGGKPTTTHLRPNSTFGAMSEIFSGISSNYNALAIQLNRRMTQHLEFMGSYTWSHSLDFGQNASTFSDTNDLLVPNSIRPEYGNSIFNVPNRFVASAVIESPWKVGGALGYLANDWQLSPIYASQSGLPYSLVTSGTPAFTVVDAAGDKTVYNALGGGVNGSNGRKGIDIIGRNNFQLKRTIDMDLRLSKKVRFGERYSAEVLGEAFNIFNHQNVTGVNNTAYILGSTTDSAGNVTPTLNFNSSFGKVTNSNSNFAYTSRQIQIGVRFQF